jgi:cation diffusion facilitator CzcD-associated flavoprotein CzcO
MNTEPFHNERSVEVAVIGAGQSGLAAGYHLAQAGRRFVILEGAPTRSALRGGAAGTRCGSSRRAGTTACRDSPFRAIPTGTPAATRSSPTSRHTRRLSSFRSA